MNRLRMGRSTLAGPAQALTIRSSEKMFVDLTADLAVFDDAETVEVEVVSTGGVLTANCWLDNTVTAAGGAETQVLRDLKDHFYVETTAATDGAVAGSMYVTGTLAATGARSTLAYEFTVDDYPTTIDRTMGDLTLPKFGGLLINDKLPGTASGWSIKTDASGLYTIFNVGTEYWLVLDGTLYTGAYSVADNVPAAPLSGMAGTTKTVVLQHASYADRTINFEVVANQFDAAPRQTGVTNGDSATATTGNQAVIFWGRYSRKASPATGDQVLMLEDGTYTTGAATMYNATNNTGTFPTTNQPTAPYEGNSWAYSEYLKPSSGWIKMTSRTPLGATFTDGVLLDAQQVNTANECMGIRISNIRTTNTNPTGITVLGRIRVWPSTGGGVVNTVMIDHCDCYGLLFTNSTNAPLDSRIFGVQNRYRSGCQLFGYDSQDCGSLWLDNPMYATGCDQYSVVTATQSNGSGGAGNILNVTDVSAQTTPLRVGSAIYLAGASASGNVITAFGTGSGAAGTYTVNGSAQLVASGLAKTFPSDLENAAVDSMSYALNNSTPGSGRCRIAYPTFIGGKAITLNHLDVVQYNGGTAFGAAVTVDSILGYGWMIAPGEPYVYTANDLQGVADPTLIGYEAAQGQSQFAQNVPTAGKLTVKMAGNVIANNIGVGTLITYPSADVIIKNNMYLFPTSITNSVLGGASPQIKFQSIVGVGDGTGITVKDNISTQTAITYNVTFVPAVTDNGNVWSITSGDQTTNLTEPDIGANATSRSKAIRAFTPKADASSDWLTKGPYFDSTKIDLWRQTADETWVTTA